METRRLGNTDMYITPIGFGSWAIGGGNWEFAWGPQDEREAIQAIERAVDLGMNWIDTAAVYGLGHSEELVGRAIGGMTRKPYIFTKCSMTWDDDRRDPPQPQGRLRPSRVRGQPDDGWGSTSSTCTRSTGRTPTTRSRRAGRPWPGSRRKARSDTSASPISTSIQMRRAQTIAPIASLQPPYSLINREVEDEILIFCRENNIGVIVYSPMASGLLTGAMTRERIAEFPPDDWRRRSPEYREPRLSRNLAMAEVLAWIGAGTADPPARSRSPGRCVTRRSPVRSSAGATAGRWKGSSARATSASTSARSARSRPSPARRAGSPSSRSVMSVASSIDRPNGISGVVIRASVRGPGEGTTKMMRSSPGAAWYLGLLVALTCCASRPSGRTTRPRPPRRLAPPRAWRRPGRPGRWKSAWPSTARSIRRSRGPSSAGRSRSASRPKRRPARDCRRRWAGSGSPRPGSMTAAARSS